MPPIIYVVRHGEGENNIENRNWIHDAPLTARGKGQCLELRDAFPDHERVSTVICSPLRRAIQTAALAFAPAIGRGDVQFIANPLAQEKNSHQCDIGHPREDLQMQLPELLKEREPAFDLSKVDMSLVEDGWYSKTGEYAVDDAAVAKRAAGLRTWLFQRSDRRVVLVTHGAFLHFLTEDWTGDDPSRGTGYLNCEVRVFNFTNSSTAIDAHLVEDPKAKADRVKPTIEVTATS